MSVRHLFGVLQRATINSLDEHLQEKGERAQFCDYPAIQGDVGSPEDAARFVRAVESAGEVEDDFGNTVEEDGVVNGSATDSLRDYDGVAGGQPPYEGTVQWSSGDNRFYTREQDALQWKLTHLDRVCAKIVVDMARCRQSGDRGRLEALEKELQVTRILKDSALRCLKMCTEEDIRVDDDTLENPARSCGPPPTQTQNFYGSTTSPAGVKASCECASTSCAPVISYSATRSGVWDSPAHKPAGAKPAVPSLPEFTTRVMSGASPPCPPQGRSDPHGHMPLRPKATSKSYCREDASTLSATRQKGGHVRRPFKTRCPVSDRKTNVKGRQKECSLTHGATMSLEPTDCSNNDGEVVTKNTSALGTSTSLHLPSCSQSHSLRCSLRSGSSLGAGGQPFVSPLASMAAQGAEVGESNSTSLEDSGDGETETRPCGTTKPPLAPSVRVGEAAASGSSRLGEDPQSGPITTMKDIINRFQGITSQTQNSRELPAGCTVRESKAGENNADSSVLRSQAVHHLRKRGNNLIKKGHYREAVEAYTEAIKFEPENGVLLCNRAVAYLLNNQYRLSLMDCENVLYNSPSNIKAHWRAAKALLCMSRTKEARYHYRKARELSTNLADGRLIAEELEVVYLVEMYQNFSREKLWSKCLWYANQLLHSSYHVSPINLPWHCLKLEALLHIDPWKTAESVKLLQKTYPRCAELLYIHAKSLFYCLHDQRSVTEALALVREANGQKKRDGDVEDSRYTHLERNLTVFEKLRDHGNAAYKGGNWSGAYEAYTSCISIDPQNTSLVAMAYCNRAAVSMQCGRWLDALNDINSSISINGGAAKAYTRRAHINIRLFSEKGESDLRLLREAVNDLRTAVKLEPSKANKQHLDEVIKMVHEKEKHFQFTYSSNANRHHNSNEGHDGPEGNSQRNSTFSSDEQKRGDPSVSAQSRVHYAGVLGLGAGAKLNERSLVKAYHKAALQWHPDRWVGANKQDQYGAEQKFKEINIAYQALRKIVHNQ